MRYFPQRIEVFWHLFEMHCVAPIFPGVSAALRSPAPEEQREV